jgi:tRNA uridine 5-carbamoylmethylation protein Kti12
MTDDTETTTELETPGDVPSIVRMLRANQDKDENEHGLDLLDRLSDKYGREEAELMWGNALSVIDHEDRVEREIQDLGLVLVELQAAATHALSSATALTRGDCRTRAYEHAGKDLITILERIGLDVRSVIALNPVKPDPAETAEFLRTVDLDVEAPDGNEVYDDAPATAGADG